MYDCITDNNAGTAHLACMMRETNANAIATGSRLKYAALACMSALNNANARNNAKAHSRLACLL